VAHFLTAFDKHNETFWGVACIVLAFCTGIGTLMAFVRGWMKADVWGLRNVMQIWTVCFILSVVFYAVYYYSTAGVPAIPAP
jgi:hypothetical protein